MKKNLLSFVLCLFCLGGVSSLQAQGITVKAGLNLGKTVISGGGLSISSGNSVGFHAGVGKNIPIGSHFIVEPGVLLTQRGGKLKYGSDRETWRIYTLEVPILLKGAFSVPSTGARISAGLGPAFNIATFGNITTKIGNNKTTDSIEFGEDGAKRFDISLMMNAGMDFKSIYLGFAYDLGLIDQDEIDGVRTKFNTFMITLGYTFGG